MSAYTDFVKQHIGKVAGKTQKDKFRAVAALWRRQKGHGKGLSPPGVHIGHGMKRKRCGIVAGTNDWSDYGGSPQLDGEGIWDTIKSVGRKVVKAVGPHAVNYALKKAPALISKLAVHHPKAAALVQKAFDYGGKPLSNLIHKKIEGLGMVHARMYLKHHMATHPPKGRRHRGGALSGPISARQQAALNAHIRGQM